MNGLLIIDKPAGITSHDVVARVRRILKTKRVGHTGTLDPFATGVMVILVGQATRLAQFLDKDEKEYEALVRFGFETDTGDRTGVRTSKAESETSKIQSLASLSVDDVRHVLENFRGEIEQTPPMYSAKKVDGKKLYEHARKGETVERKKIAVTIFDLEILQPHSRPLPKDNDQHKTSGESAKSVETVVLRVACSAGTYIRTLAEDIGRELGTGAHLAELRRTRAGKFSIDQSLTLENLDALPEPASGLIAMEDAVSHLPQMVLNDERIAKSRNGLSTRIEGAGFKDGEPVRMIDKTGSLIAIGFYKNAENIVQPKVVLV